jgi:hypothetical protein
VAAALPGAVVAAAAVAVVAALAGDRFAMFMISH